MKLTPESTALFKAVEAAYPDILGCLEQGRLPHLLTMMQGRLQNEGLGEHSNWWPIAMLNGASAGLPANDNDDEGDQFNALLEKINSSEQARASCIPLQAVLSAADRYMSVLNLSLAYCSAEDLEPTPQAAYDDLKQALISHAGLGKAQAEMCARRFKESIQDIASGIVGPTSRPSPGR